MDNNITSSETAALSAAIARSAGEGASTRGAQKVLREIAASKSQLNLKTSDLLRALSEGSKEKGDALLFKVLAVSTSYISSWGTLAIFGMGLYQAGQTTASGASWLWGQIKKIGSLASALSPLSKGFSAIFHDEAVDESPAEGVRFLATMITAEAPIIGTLFATLSGTQKDMAYDNGDPLPILHRDALAHDMAYDATEDAALEQEDGVVYDPMLDVED